jgi:hypothetical protein
VVKALLYRVNNEIDICMLGYSNDCDFEMSSRAPCYPILTSSYHQPLNSRTTQVLYSYPPNKHSPSAALLVKIPLLNRMVQYLKSFSPALRQVFGPWGNRAHGRSVFRIQGSEKSISFRRHELGHRCCRVGVPCLLWS